MLPAMGVSLQVDPLTAEQVREIITNQQGYVSCVGHESTAAVFSEQLGLHVDMVRISVSLVPDDIILVGQYIGPRLPEGATALPPGAEIRWVRAEVRHA
jgi:hypothetical protein